jgi:hypothetical protein
LPICTKRAKALTGLRQELDLARIASKGHTSERWMQATLLAIAALLTVTSATSAEPSAPLLMKEPLPPGFSEPRLILTSMPSIKSPTGSDLVACLVYDIGPDGTTSNIRIFHSTGFADLDEKIVKWYERRTWGPATLDGVPISVRLIATFRARAQAAPDIPSTPYQCTWSEAQAKTP